MRLQQWFTGTLVLVLLSSGAAHGLQSPVATPKYNAALAIFGKAKTITLTIQNASGDNIELRNGDEVVSVEPGKTVTLVLPIGSRLVYEKATATHMQGDLVETAVGYLDGATVVVH